MPPSKDCRISRDLSANELIYNLHKILCYVYVHRKIYDMVVTKILVIILFLVGDSISDNFTFFVVHSTFFPNGHFV